MNLKYCNFDEDRLHYWFQEVKRNPESVLESPRYYIKQLLRIVLESSMEELRRREIDAEYYERTSKRSDYRNGFSYKNWSTDLGLIEEIRIPRTRNNGKKLSKKIRAAYKKNKEEVHKLLREMFLAGISTERVGEVAKGLLGKKYSATYVSQTTKKLDQAVWEYHRRKLGDRFIYILFDGIVIKGRDFLGAKKRIILACHGIDLEGRRELIDFMVVDSESEADWYKFCNDLYLRGLEGKYTRLITTDGSPGLHAVLDTIWPRIPRQRCWVHKLRNIASYLKKAHMDECLFEAKLIYLAESKKEAKERFLNWEKKWGIVEPKAVNCLKKDIIEMTNFFDCPKKHWRRVRTTNVIERIFREVKRRIRPMNCFKNDASCERILYAIFFYMNRRWMWKKIGDFKIEKVLFAKEVPRQPLQLLPTS